MSDYTDWEQDFCAQCHEHGLAVTRQRCSVFHVLLESREHPTADGVYELVRSEHPGISRMSVYRILETFAHERMIRKVNHPGPATRYDAFKVPHHHLVCVHCGQIIDIDRVPEDFQIPLRHVPAGFRIHDFCVDFQGVCAECAKSANGAVSTTTQENE